MINNITKTNLCTDEYFCDGVCSTAQMNCLHFLDSKIVDIYCNSIFCYFFDKETHICNNIIARRNSK